MKLIKVDVNCYEIDVNMCKIYVFWYILIWIGINDMTDMELHEFISNWYKLLIKM